MRGFACGAVGLVRNGKQILSAVDLALPPGQHTVLLGASGSGKSTMMRLLAGLEAPGAGSIHHDGELVSSPGRVLVPPHRRGIGMVFQDLALWPNLSALENVALGLCASRPMRTERLVAARAELERVGLGERLRALPSELSGGEQQRLALARALATRPRSLFLDEPFASLDLVTRHRIVEEVARLVMADHTTMLLVTHDPFEARRLCTHAVVLDAGRVLATGVLEDLLRHPEHPLLQAMRDSLERR